MQAVQITCKSSNGAGILLSWWRPMAGGALVLQYDTVKGRNNIVGAEAAVICRPRVTPAVFMKPVGSVGFDTLFMRGHYWGWKSSSCNSNISGWDIIRTSINYLQGVISLHAPLMVIWCQFSLKRPFFLPHQALSSHVGFLWAGLTSDHPWLGLFLPHYWLIYIWEPFLLICPHYPSLIAAPASMLQHHRR